MGLILTLTILAILGYLILMLVQRYQFRRLSSYGYSEPLKHIPEDLYSFKTIKVTTDDGYILPMFRIRHRENYDSSLPPVIMQHGLSSSAINYIMGGEEKSPSLILAALG